MIIRKSSKFVSLILIIGMLFVFPANADSGEVKLIPGGTVFGVKVHCNGALVIGTNSVHGTEIGSPAVDAKIKAGDVITEISSKKVYCANDVIKAIKESGGKELSLTVNRDGSGFSTKLRPIKDSDGSYKAGLQIRDSTAGIGTVTYINAKDGSFAGLGHGICDSETGELIPLLHGSITDVTVSGITKGSSGEPGEINGYLSSGKTGSLFANTECGVYGMYASLPEKAKSDEICIAGKEDVKTGKAELLCTLGDDGVGKYDVEIGDISTDTPTRNFTVTVTDKRLIERTGGIVQGMSGSPLIQNGKLIGAVTHVFVNEPEKGYGIFIENMLDEAPDILK